MSASPLRVAIVGGGVTGLAAAHALVEQAAAPEGSPVDVTLFEASDRLGGKVRTDRIGSLIFEQGPDSLFLRSPYALDLCTRLGLSDQVVRADGGHRQSYILGRGRLHPIPSGMEGGVPRNIGPMARSGLLSPLDKLRALAEVALPAAAPAGDESLGSFIRRRFGNGVAERIAAPLLGGIYCGDLDQLSLLATMPHLRQAEREQRSLLLGAWRARGRTPARAGAPSPFVALLGGLEALPRALAARLDGVQVRLSTDVAAVDPAGDGFRLTLGSDETVETDRVIVAAPAFTAAELLRGASPRAAARLALVRYESVVVVALAFPASTAGLPRGGGLVVAPGEARRASAISFSSQKWPHCAPDGEVAVRCHFQATRTPAAMTADDARLIADAQTELRELFGMRAEPTVARVYRWPRSLASYDVGHLDRLREVDEALAALPGLALAGAGFRGAGIPECLRQGAEAAGRVLRANQRDAAGAAVRARG